MRRDGMASGMGKSLEIADRDGIWSRGTECKALPAPAGDGKSRGGG